MSSIGRRRLAIAGLAASLVACKTDATQIIVLVNTDLMVPAEIAGVDVRVETAEEGTLGAQSFDLSQHSLPLSFGIQAQPERADDQVRVVVAGVSSSGAIVVLKTARVTFVEEETLLLPMMLARVCIGRQCPEGDSCTDGDCRTEVVASLPAIEAGEELRYDAGPWPEGDGGITPSPDAETNDGGTTDAAQPLDGSVLPEDAGMPSCRDGCPPNQVCTNVLAVRPCNTEDPTADCECRQVCAPLDPDVSQCFGSSSEECALLIGGPELNFGVCLEADGRGEQGDECTIVVGGAQGCSATSSHVCVASSSSAGSPGLCARFCSEQDFEVCGDPNDARCSVQEVGALGYCVSTAQPSTSIGRTCNDGNDCDTGFCEPLIANSCTAFCSLIDDCPMGSSCVFTEAGRTDGVCLLQCQTDTDCSSRNPNTICEDIGARLCVPSCSVGGCPRGQSCQASGRCM